MSLKDYRTRAYTIALFCAVLIIIAGIILTITHGTVYGITLPNGRSGDRAFRNVSFSGVSIIIVGLLLGYYPAYLLYFKKEK